MTDSQATWIRLTPKEAGSLLSILDAVHALGDTLAVDLFDGWDRQHRAALTRAETKLRAGIVTGVGR